MREVLLQQEFASRMRCPEMLIGSYKQQGEMSTHYCLNMSTHYCLNTCREDQFSKIFIKG